ncbi:3-deoxy-7-phosphoheptulonate synthase [Martensiomyces pterosporus]|nr:3-deoxy-7-phosphoheptulonate synthase [Martensiomyces pterosporus]
MSSDSHHYVHALNELDDVNIRRIRPLIPPQILMEDLPLTESAAATIVKGRLESEAIIQGKDDRLLVIVGPCSIHNPTAALEYADHLRAYAETAAEDLCIVMRVYFEKPRTTVGWKGLINDPDLNNGFSINKGLRKARTLLLDIAEKGLPAGAEILDTISPQYIGDLISWGAIGARTTESQVHRELSSGMSVPIGFKNGTDGNVKIAVDAIKSSESPHCFLSVTKQGLSAIVETKGNKHCHIILRGGADGPNYEEKYVQDYVAQLTKAGVNPRLMIDCSHGNSSKDFRKQPIVAESIRSQLASSETGKYIAGVMIESNLVEGNQSIPADGDLSKLVYGKSITDACVNWEDTAKILDGLREGVRSRRQKTAASN